ncbi:MAG: hypothetical protein KJ749_09510 [Planctomycetes bacterium]|nr:hypothetical protein [Planctomycetota bacterium]
MANYGSQKARARFSWTGLAQRILAHIEHLPMRVNIRAEQHLPEEPEQEDADSESWLEEASLLTS